MATLAGARAGDAIAFGHTHLPWYREVGGIHFINTGTVGRPKDGDSRAGYSILDFSDSKLSADHVRVEYDVERAARGIRESDLPDQFADFLKSGKRPD
jgi:predicted phosphodiesterase